MVQVLKESVRARILEAAESRFAEVGFQNATIGDIARGAGVATGTVYKYYPDKETLFHSAITDGFVEELTRLTRQRIAAFARPGGMSEEQAPGEGESGALLRFFAENRRKVVILLGWGRGPGTSPLLGSIYGRWRLRLWPRRASSFRNSK